MEKRVTTRHLAEKIGVFPLYNSELWEVTRCVACVTCCWANPDLAIMADLLEKIPVDEAK
jgi:hypothetical protein